MAERLTITTIGKQKLVERLKETIWTALYNLPLDSNDERRADVAAIAVMVSGEYEDTPDHGSWHDQATHQ